MKIDTSKLVDSIVRAFSAVPRPRNQDYTTSQGGEAYEESSEFFDKDWRALALAFLDEFGDVLFWFTPPAFHYYLPAFLKATVEADDDSPIFVVNILQLLAGVGKESFCRDRWRRLDAAQIAAMNDWLAWLKTKAKPGGVYAKEIDVARDALTTRRWWKEGDVGPQ